MRDRMMCGWNRWWRFEFGDESMFVVGTVNRPIVCETNRYLPSLLNAESRMANDPGGKSNLATLLRSALL